MIDSSKQFPDLMRRVQSVVTGAFPIESKEHVMTLDSVRWEDFGPSVENNIALQKEYKVKEKTLAAKLLGTITIKDKKGHTVDRQTGFILVTLPHITCRTSYIVEGNELQTVNQLRLRPGPYTRYTSTNDTETFINAAGGGYRVVFLRQTGIFRLKSGTTIVDLYPVLHALGVSDSDLGNAWGSEVLEANQSKTDKDSVRKLYQSMRRYAEMPTDAAVLNTEVTSFFASKVLDPAISRITLGKEFKSITPQLLVESSKKAIALAQEHVEPDDTESLAFKSIHAVEDFVPERLAKVVPNVVREISMRMDRGIEGPKIARLISPSTFSNPVIDWFKTSEFTRYSDQHNPIDIASTNQLTTTMGEGGIQSEHAITDPLRLVHPSQMGFLDGTHSPEGGHIGVTGHLTVAAEKEGNLLTLRVFDAKTGKKVQKNTQELETVTVAFFDQFNLSGKVPVPIAPMVKARIRSKIEFVPAKKVDYIFQDPKSFFSVVTNSIPFLHNNSPNRVLMADRHIEQAVALANPDPPMVQARYSGDLGYHDFFGKFMNMQSPVDGVVERIGKEEIKIRGSDRAVHIVNLHYLYPLNSEAFLTDTPLVKVGDRVKKGQVIANNNFSKGGTLAIGCDLITAYMPYKGQNFEDAIVVSEGASKRMTSEHKYEFRFDRTVTSKIGFKIWQAHFPDKAAEMTSGFYDPDGVIKKGVTIPSKTVVIPAVDQIQFQEEMDYAKIHKSLANPFRDVSVAWDGEYPAEVVDVIKTGRFIKVFLRTLEAAQVGDKFSNRSGGKGIVTQIIPDKEMYKDSKGRTIDVIFNPAGIAGRINPGQMFEAVAGKIAEKTGKKYLVDNFSSESSLKKIQNDLKEAGLTDTETIYDPVENKKLDDIFVGRVNFMKLKHQVRHKFSAKALGPYTSDMQPAKISGESAQNIGTGEIYALLGGGSTHFLKDAMSLKSSSNPEYWRAWQMGLPTPPPQSPFILDKLVTYLEGAGINLKQEGTQFKALPLTDKDIVSRSNGAITNPSVVRASDLKPEPGGLFDRSVTGGFGGVSWSHIDLESSIPNPLMERPIISVTGISSSQFKSIMSGETFVTKDGKLVADPTMGKPAGEGIKRLLDRVDVDAQLNETIAKIRTARASTLDDLNRKRRYLQALKALKMSPSEAYIWSKVPVIPPQFRPIYPLPDGALNVADPNHCYREILLINKQLLDLKNQGVDSKNLAPLRASLYGAVQGMAGVTEPLTRSKNFKGFIATVKGQTNKFGLFQGRAVRRPQDLSGRSTVIPNPALGIDEVGLPEDMALMIYRPFVVRGLVGAGLTPNEALDLIEKKDPKAMDVLRAEIKDRPVYLNRAPTLHKFSMLPFRPMLVTGQAIHINPLIVSGFNADFDGDTMGVHTVVSEAARKEALDKLPSRNLLSVSSDSLMHAPSKEYVLGLYLMTEPKGTPAAAASFKDMMALYGRKAIKVNTPVMVKGEGIWTPGRLIVNDSFPVGFKPGNVTITGKIMKDALFKIAKEKPNEAGSVINRLKDLGAKYVTEVGFSVGLKDLEFDYKARDKILAEAAGKVKGVGFDKAYLEAVDKLNAQVKGMKDNRFVIGGILSGAFGKADQMTQMLAAPVAMTDHRDQIIQVPIKKSFAEGHDIAAYWSTLPGSRKGLMQKGLGTRDVGALSKRLVNTTIDQIISMADCGSTDGLVFPVESREALDRVVSDGPFKGKVMTPELVQKLRTRKTSVIKMRSPLKCKAIRGICQKCYGLDETGQFPAIGFHIGALAGQTVTEPVLQTMLRGFHTGGAAGRSAVGFDRIEQIYEMPENLLGKATLSSVSGSVSSVKKGLGGGWDVTVGTEDHFVPKETGLGVKKGDKVVAGQKLSATGVIKPQELLSITGDIHRVRGQIISDLQKEYSGGGIRMKQKIFEAVIKPMTDRAEVTDAGDGEKFHVYRGDIVSVNAIDEVNKKIGKGRKILYQSTLLPIRVSPYHGDDLFGKLMFERLHETLQRAPATLEKADTAKGHPITRVAFGGYKRP